jgi:gamma-glutamylputrescine oxidase
VRAPDVLTANDRSGRYPPSWYAATVPLPEPLPQAQGAIRADICVIGGGYTGLSAALHLAERGYDVVLVEAHRAGWGASGRNGGQIAVGQRVDQETLEARLGREMAARLWDLGLASVDLVHSLCARHRIDCDYVPGLVEADHRARHVRHTHAYVEKLQRVYGYDRIAPLDRAGLRALVDAPGYFGGAVDSGSGHLHPLKLALGLARAAQSAGVRLFEGSRVTRLLPGDPVRIELDGATVTARFALLAANGYLGGLVPDVAARVMPINNFIVATEPLGKDRASALLPGNHAVGDSRFVINYFRRSPDHRLLFGGGESYGLRFPRDIAALVRRPMEQVFPQLRGVGIDFAWGGTLAITLPRLPHVARLSGNLMSAGGYSGHGVAMATFAGQVMADAIAGQAERFDLMAEVPIPAFPGGAALRGPLLTLGMIWYALRDRL